MNSPNLNVSKDKSLVYIILCIWNSLYLKYIIRLMNFCRLSWNIILHRHSNFLIPNYVFMMGGSLSFLLIQTHWSVHKYVYILIVEDRAFLFCFLMYYVIISEILQWPTFFLTYTYISICPKGNEKEKKNIQLILGLKFGLKKL